MKNKLNIDDLISHDYHQKEVIMASFPNVYTGCSNILSSFCIVALGYVGTAQPIIILEKFLYVVAVLVKLFHTKTSIGHKLKLIFCSLRIVDRHKQEEAKDPKIFNTGKIFKDEISRKTKVVTKIKS